MVELTAVQEHYLKRELLRLELETELENFNDTKALRKFGYPFVDGDPVNYAPSRDSNADKFEYHETYPLLKYFFNSFVLTIPFLSEEQAQIDQFWVRKVQVFYEHFMELSLSDTMDRDEATKRKKFGQKLSKFILMVYNSGIGTKNEVEYYQTAKYEIGEKLEDKRLDKLLLPSKETLQDHISKNVFINGISLNVAGVRKVSVNNNNLNNFKSNLANGKFWNSINNVIAKPNETYYEFLIKTVNDLPEGQEVWVARRYNDFKKLHHDLKKRFPGKHVPNLPAKIKSEVVLGGEEALDEEVQDEEEDDDDENGIDEFHDAEEQSIKTQDEEIKKNINLLIKDLNIDAPASTSVPSTPKLPSTSKLAPQQVKSPKTPKQSSFFNTSNNLFKSPKTWIPSSSLLSPTSTGSSAHSESNKTRDTSNRIPREKMRIALRSYLRKLLKNKEFANCDLLKEFLNKSKIPKLNESELNDVKVRENLDLLILNNQIQFQNSAYLKIKELKALTEPIKSTLLETDDGIIKIFSEFKTKSNINDLSPMLKNFIEWCKIEISATIYQLFLGNDNSYQFFSQVKRFHKLIPYSVMINILRFTNPMSIMKAMLDLMMANPFGGKSLLQTLFYGILADDIKQQNKVITELENTIGHASILKRFKYFVYECQDETLIKSIRDESINMNTDLALTIIITPQLNSFITIDDSVIGDVFESYNEYKKLKMDDEELSIRHDKTELYSNLKTIFKLYVKNHDKDILKQIWSEPELISILKDLLTMFYQPLVELFRNAHVDVALKNFESFMDELIIKIEKLSNEIYTTDTSKIVDEITQVINNHQDEFYRFLHDVYINDSDMIFQKMIIWINNLLKFLRNSKNLNNNLNLRLDLNELIAKNAVDEQAVVNEIDSIIERIKIQRKNYLEKLNKSKQGEHYDDEEDDHEDVNESEHNLIKKNWETINNVEIFKTDDFGLNENDLIDLNNEIDSEQIEVKEIKKLSKDFKDEVINILKHYK